MQALVQQVMQLVTGARLSEISDSILWGPVRALTLSSHVPLKLWAMDRKVLCRGLEATLKQRSLRTQQRWRPQRLWPSLRAVGDSGYLAYSHTFVTDFSLPAPCEHTSQEDTEVELKTWRTADPWGPVFEADTGLDLGLGGGSISGRCQAVQWVPTPGSPVEDNSGVTVWLAVTLKSTS